MTVPATLSVALAGWPPGSTGLPAALAAAGITVLRASPVPELRRTAAQIVLVPAETSPAELARLRGRLHADDSGPTLVVVGADPAEVEPHVLAGYDYLIPPYRPALVRHRLAACRDRDRLARTTHRPVPAGAGQLEVGREIQRGFLPSRLPERRDWELAARYQPALEVGGDFYDAFEVDGGRWMVVALADVCDKGVGAALFMTPIRTLLRQAAENPPGGDGGDAATAAALLAWVRGTNGYLVRNHADQGYFATLFIGIVSTATGVLSYVNAGHLPALLRRQDGDPELLMPTGPVLGIFPDELLSVGQVRLRTGDLLLICSDGVTEARDRGGVALGDERVRWLVQAVQEDSPPRLLDRLDRLVRLHALGVPQHDDITMLALRRSAA